MTSKARINYDLLFIVGFREFDEKDLRREVVDVGDAESDQGIRKLVCDDLGVVKFSQTEPRYFYIP